MQSSICVHDSLVCFVLLDLRGLTTLGFNLNMASTAVEKPLEFSDPEDEDFVPSGIV